MAISSFHNGRSVSVLVGNSGTTRVDIDTDLDGANRMSVESTVTPTSVSNRFEIDAENGGGSNELNINGGGTPVTFSILAEATFDLFITELRLHGIDGGIRFDRFLGQNNPLTNGIDFSIKSNDAPVGFDSIFTTADIKARFATLGGWALDPAAGGDHFLGSLSLVANPLAIRSQGTFGTDDVLSIIINDNLSNVDSLFLTAIGFKR